MQVRLVLEYAVLASGLFGLLSSTVFLGMVLVGVRAFLRDARRQEKALSHGPEFLPGVTLFKPLHGAESGLEGNLRSFFEQDLWCGSVSGGDSVLCTNPGRCGHADRAAGRSRISGSGEPISGEWRTLGGEREGVFDDGDGEGCYARSLGDQR